MRDAYPTFRQYTFQMTENLNRNLQENDTARWFVKLW